MFNCLSFTDPDPAGQPLALVVWGVLDDQERPLAEVEDLITEAQYRGSSVVQYRRWVRSFVNNSLGVKTAQYLKCLKYQPLTRDDYLAYDLARPAQLAPEEASGTSEDDYSFLDQEDNSRDHAYMEVVKRLMNDMAREQRGTAHPSKEAAETLNQLRKDLLDVAGNTQPRKARVLTPNELAVQKAAKELQRATQALENSQGVAGHGRGAREGPPQQQAGLGGLTSRGGGGRDGYSQPAPGSGGRDRRGNNDENRNPAPGMSGSTARSQSRLTRRGGPPDPSSSDSSSSDSDPRPPKKSKKKKKARRAHSSSSDELQSDWYCPEGVCGYRATTKSQKELHQRKCEYYIDFAEVNKLADGRDLSRYAFKFKEREFRAQVDDNLNHLHPARFLSVASDWLQWHKLMPEHSKPIRMTYFFPELGVTCLNHRLVVQLHRMDFSNITVHMFSNRNLLRPNVKYTSSTKSRPAEEVRERHVMSGLHRL